MQFEKENQLQTYPNNYQKQNNFMLVLILIILLAIIILLRDSFHSLHGLSTNKALCCYQNEESSCCNNTCSNKRNDKNPDVPFIGDVTFHENLVVKKTRNKKKQSYLVPLHKNKICPICISSKRDNITYQDCNSRIDENLTNDNLFPQNQIEMKNYPKVPSNSNKIVSSNNPYLGENQIEMKDYPKIPSNSNKIISSNNPYLGGNNINSDIPRIKTLMNPYPNIENLSTENFIPTSINNSPYPSKILNQPERHLDESIFSQSQPSKDTRIIPAIFPIPVILSGVGNPNNPNPNNPYSEQPTNQNNDICCRKCSEL